METFFRFPGKKSSLITTLFYRFFQVAKLKNYIKDHWQSCLTITRVSTKESWKNPVNFPWTLKENKLCIEIYKTLNNSNLSLMKEIFEMFQACKRGIKTEFKYSKKKVGRLWK